MREEYFTLFDSAGRVILTASSRELDPDAEYWLHPGPPEGWFGGYSMRGDNEQRLGHGEFSARRTRSGRTLNLQARIHLRSWEECTARKRALSAALGDGEPGLLRGVMAGQTPLETVVERTGEILIGRVSPSTFSISIPLIAPEPELHGPWRETTLRPRSAGVGLRYPLFARAGVQSVQPGGVAHESPVLDWGDAVATSVVIWNDGNVPSAPRFTVWGDFPGGFTIGVDQQRVTYPWPTMSTIPVTVDMAGTVTVGGADQTHLLTEHGWGQVPAESMSTPHFEPLQGGSGFTTVEHRDTYL